MKMISFTTNAAREVVALSILCVITFVYMAVLFIHDAADWIFFIIAIFLVAALAALLKKMKHEIKVIYARSTQIWKIAIVAIALGLVSMMAIAGITAKEFDARAYLVFIVNCSAILFVYVCMISIFFLVGSRALRLLNLNIGEQAADAIAAIVGGMVITILFFYSAALLHVASQSSVLVFVIAGVLFGWSEFPRLRLLLTHKVQLSLNLRQWGDDERRTLLFVLLWLFAIFAFLNNAYPQPFDGDSLHTYFNIPYLIRESGALIHFPYDQLNNGSFASSFLYLPVVIIGPHYLNYINILLFILVACSCTVFANLFLNRRIGFYSVVTLLSIDLLIFLVISVKSDLLLALLILWSAIAAVYSLKHEQSRWMLCAGIFYGVAIAVKYTALFGLPAAIITIFLSSLVMSKKVTTALSHSILFVSGIIAGFAPWGLRQLMIFGDPLYPFSFLGNRIYYSAAAQSLLRAFSAELSIVTHKLSLTQPLLVNWAVITTNSSEYPNDKIGPLIAVVPFFVLLWRRYSPELVSLLVGSAITIVVWYSIAVSQVWYIVFVFPFLALIFGHYWDSLRSPRVKYIFAIIISILIVSHLPMGRLSKAYTLFEPYTEASLVVPTESVEYYLNTVIAKERGTYVVLPFGPIRAALVGDNDRHIAANVFMETWISIVADNQTFDSILTDIHRRGITHIYYDTRYVPFLAEAVCEKQSCRATQLLLDRMNELLAYSKKKYETPQWIMYEIQK